MSPDKKHCFRLAFVALQSIRPVSSIGSISLLFSVRLVVVVVGIKFDNLITFSM